MGDITRRLPNSNITRLSAIRELKLSIDALPVGTVTLPPDMITNLPMVVTTYSNAYDTVTSGEAELSLRVATKGGHFLRLKTATIDFLKVLRITIDRSLVMEDGQWAAADTSYYNLDETGGNLPDIRTDEKLQYWANEVVNGEAARKAAKPAAPDMSNPSAMQVSALITPFQGAMSAVVIATNALTTARNNLHLLNPDVDAFIVRAWDFLEANYSNLDNSAKRNMLRQFGVTYVSNGTPNTITLLVKDATAAPLEGAKMVVIESGAEAFANEEGRISLQTASVGALQLLLSYPGKTNQTIPLTIPDTAEGETFNLPDVVMI